MELGQPKHLKQQTDGGGLIRTRLEEGDNVHRVLFGPVKISLQYYPTLVEDGSCVYAGCTDPLANNPTPAFLISTIYSFPISIRLLIDSLPSN